MPLEDSRREVYLPPLSFPLFCRKRRATVFLLLKPLRDLAKVFVTREYNLKEKMLGCSWDSMLLLFYLWINWYWEISLLQTVATLKEK